MRKCPFCRQAVKMAMPYLMHLDELDMWSFHHSCKPDISVIITSKTREGIVQIWNGEDNAEIDSAN